MSDGSTAQKKTFETDREHGERLEQMMLTALEWSFPESMWIKHDNCSGTQYWCHCFDLEDLATQRSIECKRDWYAQHSGNMCFETYLVDPDKCKADYLAHEVAHGELYMFRVDDLRYWLPRMGKPIMVGDGKRTEAWVLEKKYVLTHVPHIRVDLRRALPELIFG